MIEPFKIALKSRRDRARQDQPARAADPPSLVSLSRPGAMGTGAGPAVCNELGVLDWARADRADRLLPPTLRRMQAMLPKLTRSRGRLPEVLPAKGPKRARVALFLGCVADAMFPETNAATARVLQENGCEVVIPRAQVCCGAIHYHSGVEQPALELARQNLAAFDAAQVDAIIVNAAGCGAMLKDYAHILPPESHDRGGSIRRQGQGHLRVLGGSGADPPRSAVPLKVTYHDACHLCHGQQIRSQPRALLAMIPGLEVVPLEESEICCGAAGTYNLTQPEMSERLGKRKMDHIEATGATMVVTGNVGCILQIARKIKERGRPIEVAHPVDLLDRAYRADRSD